MLRDQRLGSIVQLCTSLASEERVGNPYPTVDAGGRWEAARHTDVKLW